MADRDSEKQLDQLEVDAAKTEPRPSAPIWEIVQPNAIVPELMAITLRPVHCGHAVQIDHAPKEPYPSCGQDLGR